MPAPLTAAAAIAAFNSNSLPAGTTIFDSAFHVANTADALQAIVTANPALITSILFNNPDRPAVPVTVAQLAADAGLGPLINSPASFTQRVTAAAASTTILAAGFTSISVVDSAANIQANIAGIQTLYSQGWLGPIFYTDSGTPIMSLSAASVAANIAALSRMGGINIVLTDPGTPTLTLPSWATFLGAFSNVVALISTPFNLAFAGAIRSFVITNIEDQAGRVTNFTIRGQATDPITPLGVIYSGYLPSGLNVFDNPLYPAVFLESLQIAAVAGKLNSVTGYYSGPNLISLTPAMADANALALSKFSPNFQYSQIITAAQAAAPPVLDARFFNYTVQDTIANILANITAVNALFRSSRAAYLITAESEPNFVMTAAQFAQAALPLATYGDEFLAVTLTDAGTPTMTLAADVLALTEVRANVLRYVTGPYHLAITGAISAQLAANIVSENTVVKTSLTGVAIFDNANAIVANIGALNALVSLGAISAITIYSRLGTIQALNLTTGQQTTYAAVLAKISGPYIAGTATSVPSSMSAASFVANLSTIESGVLAGAQGAIVLTDPGTPTITVSAATLLANLDAFALITSVPIIVLTDGGTPALALSAGQATQSVLTALSRISSSFTFSISGPVSTPVAAFVSPLGLMGKLSAPLNILDVSFTLDFSQPSRLPGLQSLYAAGKLGTITLADSPYGPTIINLTAAQATANAGALSAIVSPHTFGLVVSAAQAASTTIPQGIFQYLQISDTTANIVANLPALESLAPSGKFAGIGATDTNALSLSAAQVASNYDALRYDFGASITLTDGGTPTIEIQNWQFANDASALNRITSPFKLQIDGPLRVNNAFTLANAGYASKIVSGSLLVRDTGGSVVSALSQLSTLYTAGALASIEFRTSVTNLALPILSLPSGQLPTLNSIAPAITAPYLVSQIISVANLPSPTLAAGFNFFTIKDSVANILANLPALQTIAAGAKLNAVLFTDAVPRIVTSASAISANADFWNQYGSGPFPIVLTDGGTPTISVQSGQLGNNLRNNVLDTIAGPYSLQITGTVSASLAGSIVEENNSVLRSLTGNLTIADNTANIAQYYDQLEYLARLGRIVSITVRDTGGTINVTPSQAAADSAITPLIQGSYTLAQTAPCFAEGTHIRTQRGQIKVEALEVGDIAITATGSRPITWIGHRRVDCARHPRPWDVNPVRVARHAFAPSRPMRDLWLSPDHAVFHNGVLIPIRYLINGATIIQEARDAVTYFHVELDSHDILMAEALPTESFLDTGNRGAFANGDGAMMLHPDFALKIWEASACAPLVLDGALVAAARNHLFERAKELGHATTEDPDLHLLADGVVIRPDWIGAKIVFLLPNRFTALRLVSRSHVPADISPAALDRRQLGVAVIALVVDGRPVVASPGDGWYAAEDGLQWTDGNAAIPVQGGAVLELRVAGIGRYWDNTSIYRLPLAQRG